MVLGVDGESGRHRGEQIGLCSQRHRAKQHDGFKRKIKTHGGQRGVRVLIIFLHKVAVMVVGFTLEFVVEFDTDGAGGSKRFGKRNGRALGIALCVGKAKRGQLGAKGGR